MLTTLLVRSPLLICGRFASTGLQAIADVAASIKSGFYEIGIGAGVESMTLGSKTAGWQGTINSRFVVTTLIRVHVPLGAHGPMCVGSIFANQQAKDCLLPMGITSENVAAEYKASPVLQAVWLSQLLTLVLATARSPAPSRTRWLWSRTSAPPPPSRPANLRTRSAYSSYCSCL